LSWVYVWGVGVGEWGVVGVASVVGGKWLSVVCGSKWLSVIILSAWHIVHLLSSWNVVEEWKTLYVLVVCVVLWYLDVVSVTSDAGDGGDEFFDFLLKKKIFRCHFVETVESVHIFSQHHFFSDHFLKKGFLHPIVLDKVDFEEISLDEMFSFDQIIFDKTLNWTLFYEFLVHLCDWVNNFLLNFSLDFSNFLWFVKSKKCIFDDLIKNCSMSGVWTEDIFLVVYVKKELTDDFIVVIVDEWGLLLVVVHFVDVLHHWVDNWCLDVFVNNWVDIFIEEDLVLEECWEYWMGPVVLELRSSQVDLEEWVSKMLTKERKLIVDSE